MSNIPVAVQPGQEPLRPASRSVRKSRLFLLFVVMITFFVPALLTLHGLKARRVDASTTTGPEITVAAMPAPVPPPSDDQIMSFAYFIEQGDMNSTLRLNNNLLSPMTATVTFFNIHGESFTPPVLTLPPQDVQRFSIAELTANAPRRFPFRQRSGCLSRAGNGADWPDQCGLRIQPPDLRVLSNHVNGICLRAARWHRVDSRCRHTGKRGADQYDERYANGEHRHGNRYQVVYSQSP